MSEDERDPLVQWTVAYVDGLFGPGTGERHAQFLDSIENPTLRRMMHQCHSVEGDTHALSTEENYLLGMAVLCAVRSHATAAMFAKTLRHLGTSREKILEAVARLAMWIGSIPAAEAAAHVQRALDDYDKRGFASLEAWFPERRTR